MAKVKQALSEILNHELCNGFGWWYWADGKDEYHVESCECNPYSIPADEILDWRI